MGLLWRLSPPSSADREKTDRAACTWKDFADKRFEIILTRHLSASMIIAVNDCYGNNAVDIRDGEHQKQFDAYVCGQTRNAIPAFSCHKRIQIFLE